MCSILRSRFDTLGWEFPSWSATPGPAFNILKGGILAADRVLTVSEVRVSAD